MCSSDLSFYTERDGGDSNVPSFDGAIDDLETLPVSESKAKRRFTFAEWQVVSPWLVSFTREASAESRRGLGQHDNARVFLWEPENRSVRGWDQGIDGEIAAPTAAVSARSVVQTLRDRKLKPRNLHHRRRCGVAIPRRDRKRLAHPDGHIPRNARSMRQVSSLILPVSV